MRQSSPRLIHRSTPPGLRVKSADMHSLNANSISAKHVKLTAEGDRRSLQPSHSRKLLASISSPSVNSRNEVIPSPSASPKNLFISNAGVPASRSPSPSMLGKSLEVSKEWIPTLPRGKSITRGNGKITSHSAEWMPAIPTPPLNSMMRQLPKNNAKASEPTSTPLNTPQWGTTSICADKLFSFK